MVPVRCPVWDSPTPWILTFLSLECEAFIWPRKSSRAQSYRRQATAIIRDRRSWLVRTGNDAAAIFPVFSLLSYRFVPSLSILFYSQKSIRPYRNLEYDPRIEALWGVAKRLIRSFDERGMKLQRIDSERNTCIMDDEVPRQIEIA